MMKKITMAALQAVMLTACIGGTDNLEPGNECPLYRLVKAEDGIETSARLVLSASITKTLQEEQERSNNQLVYPPEGASRPDLGYPFWNYGFLAGGDPSPGLLETGECDATNPTHEPYLEYCRYLLQTEGDAGLAELAEVEGVVQTSCTLTEFEAIRSDRWPPNVLGLIGYSSVECRWRVAEEFVEVFSHGVWETSVEECEAAEVSFFKPGSSKHEHASPDRCACECYQSDSAVDCSSCTGFKYFGDAALPVFEGSDGEQLVACEGYVGGLSSLLELDQAVSHGLALCATAICLD